MFNRHTTLIRQITFMNTENIHDVCKKDWSIFSIILVNSKAALQLLASNIMKMLENICRTGYY